MNAPDVADLAALTARASELTSKVELWTTISIWVLWIAALAAIATVLSQRALINKTRQRDAVQQRIDIIKERVNNSRISDLQNDSMGLQRDLEKQKQLTADAESARLQLVRQIHPRSISDEQRAILTAGIRAAGWKDAEIIWHGIGEPEIYARDLARAFHDAGAKTLVHTLGPFIPEAWGLSVIQTSNSDAKGLQALLDSAGVPSGLVVPNDGEIIGIKDHPTLFVGTRQDVGTPAQSP